jgi:hypothetical protein
VRLAAAVALTLGGVQTAQAQEVPWIPSSYAPGVYRDPILPLPRPVPIDPIDLLFPPEERETARCIRWHESRDDPTAVSPTDDHGWFQINAPTWRPYFGEARWSLIYSPYENTVMAYEVWERAGRTWTPWATRGLCDD